MNLNLLYEALIAMSTTALCYLEILQNMILLHNGVNHDSVLNDIPDFNVANGQMPQDAMHILLEGVLPFELKLMLKVFVSDKHYFELDDLNERLNSFVFGRNESRTKPPKAFERKHVMGDASLRLSG